MMDTQSRVVITNQPAAAIQPQTAPAVNLPLLTAPQEFMEVMKENRLDGENFRFDKIPMPSDGGITFVMMDEKGGTILRAELRGVILKFSHFKSWYQKSFDERDENDDKRPDCFSQDGEIGSGCPDAGIPPEQKCEFCPKNQWGSDRRGGRGKDCADKIRIYILLEESALPVFIDLPPASIGNFKEYRKRLTNKLKSLHGVVTVIGLEMDKSITGGITYSKATFAKAADLNPDERAIIKQYIDTISPSLKQRARHHHHRLA